MIGWPLSVHVAVLVLAFAFAITSLVVDIRLGPDQRAGTGDVDG